MTKRGKNTIKEEQVAEDCMEEDSVLGYELAILKAHGYEGAVRFSFFLFLVFVCFFSFLFFLFSEK